MIMDFSMLSEFGNYGILGVLVVILTVGIKVLYTRNCAYGDKVSDLVSKNTEAMTEHTHAIRELTIVIREIK